MTRVGPRISDDDYRARFQFLPRSASGCWLFDGCVTTRGYGSICYRGKTTKPHRLAYELFVGPIPDGFDLDHECHNQDSMCSGGPECLHRRCCNPFHVTPATRLANLHGGRVNQHVRRTRCAKGHPFDRVLSGGRRGCSVCINSRNRAYRQRIVARRTL